MAEADPVSGVFHRPFTEQVAFFRRKLGKLVPTQRWDDMLREAHDEGFMVAGAMSADLLADLGAAVDKAIAEGTGIEAFRRDFRAIVRRHGWTGWTGEGSVKGEAWRVGAIYRTNMTTSYAAGRYAQLVAGNFEFWVYRHGGSREPREEHLHVFDGLVLPPSHPFWQKFYPPSDWGCSCYVVGASSLAQAKRLGGDPDRKLPDGWDKIDPATGAPAGIGRGWDYAPGASVVDKVNGLTRALDRLPAELAIGVVRSWHDRAIFERWADAAKATPSVAGQGWPLVRIPDADAAAIGSTQKLAMLSPATLEKQAINHPDLTWDDYKLAQAVVSAPTAQVQDGPSSMIYVQELSDEERGGLVLVVQATRTGEGLFVKSFRRLSRDEAKRDRAIRQLLRKGGRR